MVTFRMANFPLDAALEGFAHEVNQPDAEINLARAALVMGRFEYPDLDVSGYLNKIDRLAESAGRVIQSAELPALMLAQFLFDTLGFAGNARNYTDPRNSFLNEVLERRLGIPISLSVLFLEVAHRAGIHADGVGLPGHFIVRVVLDTGQVIYLDPFHGGAVLSEEDCRERVRAITDGKLPFNEAFLNPVSARYILVRMLNNLKNFYAAANDFYRASKVVERLLIVNPNDLTEVRNLGLLYGALGRHRQAVALLETYLQGRPDASDAAEVKKYISSISNAASRWN
jgi:regulator of sirC expression with transglutaminase-like and TPR domain